MKMKHIDGTISEVNPKNDADVQALEALGLVKVEEGSASKVPEKMNKPELTEFAKGLGIEVTDEMTKAQILEAVTAKTNEAQ